MQKARIRTGWKNKNRQISVKDFANALSAICWRISLNAAKNLHEQNFIYDNDEQRIGVMQEYLHFFIHCSDRLMFNTLDQDQRTEFVTTLSMDCRRHYIENSKEILGRQTIDESVSGLFIESLNQNMEAMSEFRFENDEPGYEMHRLLGARIQDIMGNSQTNKWVIDQVMDIDGPEAYDIFKKSFNKLKRSSGF